MRQTYLLLGDDPFRLRLRLAELVAALSNGRPAESAGLVHWASPDLGSPLGVTRHDGKDDSPEAIVMSGASQGLFAALDERRVVIVERAELLPSDSLVAEFPPDAALILVTTEKLPTSRGRRGATRAKKQPQPESVDLQAAVKGAGGRVERISRLPASEVPGWITGRSLLRGLQLAPAAVHALAVAVGPDSDRIEQELAKLAAFVGERAVEAADVRALVAGAIESDVFALTEAVVRQDTKAALARLDELLADGQAAQQILALLFWQFRVLLFASAMRGAEDANRMAKAIHASSPASLYRWQAQARRVDRKIVTRAYETLYATDLAIKQGRLSGATPAESDAMALTLCVLDLCGIASADMRELVVGEPPHK